MATLFGVVTLDQLDNLADHHPQLAALKTGDMHYPSFLNILPDCPAAPRDFPCFYYLQQGEELVASLAALPDTLTANGSSLPWAWAGAFFTSTRCRGQGLGKELWKQTVEALHAKGYVMAGAFANPVTTHICRSMGFIIADRIPRRLLLKSARPFLGYHLKNKRAVSVLDRPYRTLASSLRYLTGHSSLERKGIVLERDVDGDCFASRLRDVAPRYDTPLTFDDSTEKFAWKVTNSTETEVYLASVAASHEPIARFVTKSRLVKGKFANKYSGFRLMTLMDFVAYRDPKVAYKVVADAILDIFWDTDAEVLETVAASPGLNGLLRRKLLVSVGQGVAYWYKPPPNVTLPESADAISSWHLTHFCTDAFTFG